MRVYTMAALAAAVLATACTTTITYHDMTGQNRDLNALQMDGAACQMQAQSIQARPAQPGCNAGCAMMNVGTMMQERSNSMQLCMMSKGWQEISSE